MKCFWPFSTQPAPSRTARVRMPAASEPAPGSVMAMEPVRAPVTEGCSQRACWAGVPASSTS